MSVEALEGLLESPGWKLYQEHVYGEWGPNGHQFQVELDKALNLTDNNAAASQARQIRSGQKVIVALLRWPSEEVNRLKRAQQTPEVTMSRRGGL